MANITVCIKCDDKGQYSVGAMPAEAQAPVEGAPAAPEDEAAEQQALQPVKSLDEALQVAGDLLKNAGQVNEAAQGEADFKGGFGKGAGAPAGRPMRGQPGY